jgi:hypothetical protein
VSFSSPAKCRNTPPPNQYLWWLAGKNQINSNNLLQREFNPVQSSRERFLDSARNYSKRSSTPELPFCDSLLQTGKWSYDVLCLKSLLVQEQAKQRDVPSADKAWRIASCLFNHPGLTHFIHNPLIAITVGLEISTFRCCFMDLKSDVAIRLHVRMTANSLLRIFGRKRKTVKLGER